MFQVLHVNFRGYYWWKTKIISNKVQRMNQIKEKITSTYYESKQHYFNSRISIESQSIGFKISRVTEAKHNYLVVENILNRQFTPCSPSKIYTNFCLNFGLRDVLRSLVSNITYINTKDGFLYLSIVIDL